MNDDLPAGVVSVLADVLDLEETAIREVAGKSQRVEQAIDRMATTGGTDGVDLIALQSAVRGYKMGENPDEIYRPAEETGETTTSVWRTGLGIAWVGASGTLATVLTYRVAHPSVARATILASILSMTVLPCAYGGLKLWSQLRERSVDSGNPTRRSGLLRAPQIAYNTLLRPHLPWVMGEFSGVRTRYAKPLDLTRTNPEYKKGMVRSIEKIVSPGDVVCEIGVGRGVLTVKCLENGAETIRGYEASEEMIQIAKETLDRNVTCPWRGIVDLEHAMVGSSGDVYGEMAERVVDPAELSDADVMILDCEGAELEILHNLGTLPDVVICETHIECDVPYWKTKSVLEARGYRVDRVQYEPGVSVGVKPVLVGVLLDDDGEPVRGGRDV